MEEFKLEFQETMKAVNQNIDAIRKGFEADKAKMKENSKEMFAELEQKKDKLNARLSEYKDEGLEKWEAFKTEFKRDVDQLGKAIKDFSVKNTH